MDRTLELIDRYYPEDGALKRLLLRHSEDVCRKALSIIDANPHLNIDRQFVEQAAMLHDIGIFTTDAPDIYCYGKDPYILHGRNGAEILRKEGLTRHARVCERHTGAGLTKKSIIARNLPLPHEDFLPETMEEILICYADKFYSKSHPERTKTIEQAVRSLSKFGKDGPKRFLYWAKMFGEV